MRRSQVAPEKLGDPVRVLLPINQPRLVVPPVHESTSCLAQPLCRVAIIAPWLPVRTGTGLVLATVEALLYDQFSNPRN